MTTVGITGSIGAGKTTVANMFKGLGAIVLDADAVAHRLIEPDKEGWEKIRESFGDGILKKDRTIDRKALADKVFSDKRRLKRLCGIIHPLVYKEFEEALRNIERAKPEAVVVLDIPLLFESGAEDKVDRTIVVKSRRDVQIRRASKGLGLSRAEVLRRIRCQMPLKKKLSAADFVIDNSGRLDSTKRQALRIWKILTGR